MYDRSLHWASDAQKKGQISITRLRIPKQAKIPTTIQPRLGLLSPHEGLPRLDWPRTAGGSAKVRQRTRQTKR